MNQIKTIPCGFSGVGLEIVCDAALEKTVLRLASALHPTAHPSLPAQFVLSVKRTENGITLCTSSSASIVDTSLHEFPVLFWKLLIEELSNHIGADRIVFRSAAVRIGNCVVLIPGAMRVGKTMLTAWLIGAGFQLLSDDIVSVAFNRSDWSFEYLPSPMKFGAGELALVSRFLEGQITHSWTGADTSLIQIDANPPDQAADCNGKPSLLIFPRFVPGHLVTVSPLSPGRAGLYLLHSLVGNIVSAGSVTGKISALSKSVVACELVYGGFEQLTEHYRDLLTFMAEQRFTYPELSRFLDLCQRRQQAAGSVAEHVSAKNEFEKTKVPEPTPLGPKKRLTIGMATYDDYDGVYFTIQSIRLYHQEVIEKIEIIVIDNHPGGRCSHALKELEKSIDGYRYVPYQGQSGTAVRDQIFREANGDFVLSVDCHVLIVPGALQRLLDYFEEGDVSNDLLQGPLLHDNGKKLSTHFTAQWNEGMYGVWGYDERAGDPAAPPFEISMQGLGLFACKKTAWPGFNPRFRGFGGEEGYIHQKIRNNGGSVICLPFLRWMHRFQRPLGVPYTLIWKDRIFNYMIGFREIGWNTDEMKNHFIAHLGADTAGKLFIEVERELNSPFLFFDAVYCITMNTASKRWTAMRRRLAALGVANRVRIFSAIETPDCHHIGCTLSHRAIIAEAQRQQLDNVLVFEDDAQFLDDTIACLEKSVAELAGQEWQVFYLGGHRWGQTFPFAEGCTHLRRAKNLTCTHAVAYHSRSYQKILEEIPDTIEAVRQWTKTYHAIDQYLRCLDGLYLAEPVVATQPPLLAQEHEAHRTRFILGDPGDHD